MGTLNCRIALKFDRDIGSTAAEVPVKFQSDRTILNTNLAVSRLYEISRKDVFSDIETGPCTFHPTRYIKFNQLPMLVNGAPDDPWSKPPAHRYLILCSNLYKNITYIHIMGILLKRKRLTLQNGAAYTTTGKNVVFVIGTIFE